VLPLLHHGLQLGLAPEGNADGELHAEELEQFDHLVAEEGTVHPHLDDYPRHLPFYLQDTVTDEVKCTSGVMDVSRAVKEVEDLAQLGDGAEQRVVTALAFLLGVVPDSRPLGFAAGAQYRPIEVEGDPAKREEPQAADDQLANRLAQKVDTLVISGRQGPADRGYVGQLAQTEKAKHKRIVPVVPDLPQAPVAQQQVDHEQEIEPGVVEDVAGLEVPVATAEPPFQVKVIEHTLEEDQAGEGGQPLALEAKKGKFSGGFLHVFSARLGHEKRSPLVSNCWFLVEPILTHLAAAFLFLARFCTSPRVDYGNSVLDRSNPRQHWAGAE